MITRIVADSSIDVRALDGVEFRSVPLSISTAETIFTDDEKLDLNGMLSYLAAYKGRSYTSCPSIGTWLDAYRGADVLYVITLSSGVSGTYNMAMAAAEQYREERPEVRVRVFDTLSAGPGIRLLADKLAECVREGKEFDEVCAAGDAYMKKVRTFLSLESFNNFASNGRVSRVAAAAAGVLGIRVMAAASAVGQIEIVAKCRGEKSTVKEFLKQMAKNGYDGGKVYIVHCQNPGLAAEIRSQVRKEYPDAEFSVLKTGGLTSYYVEKGGIVVSFECSSPVWE